jgi:uncharacterized membrane protein YfcA
MTPLAWLGALAIGLTLGLLGSGGSILTVPVLVYLVGVPDKIAIAESLAIVGLIAAIGATPYARRGLVSWSTVVLFGLPGMAGSYVGALAAKSISGHVQMLLFAVLMLAAALSMLRPTVAALAPPGTADAAADGDAAWSRYRVIIVQGFGVGTMTGLVGVGGGFLVIPALVLLIGLPMHVAIGTSLSIVALNSATGFYKHHQVLAAAGLSLNPTLIGAFAAIGSVGSLVGSAIGQHIPQQQLRRVFAVFVLLLGGFLLWKNLGH